MQSAPEKDDCDKPEIADGEGTPREASLEAELKREPNRFKRFLKILGPGLITGASDDDPSGIGTYAMAGASLGFASLWTALVTFPLMTTIQYICAKVGLVTGRGLAGVIRQNYSKWILYPAVIGLVLANSINAGADIGAIAAGINLLVPIPEVWLIVPISLLILALQIWGSYRLIAKIFKWLTLALFGYIGSAFFAKPDWSEVLRGTLIPTIRFDSEFLAMLVAILGTTISPYLFFWQTSLEVEDRVARGCKNLWQRKGASDADLKYAALDVGTGMFFSNIVMYFIILATAATLHRDPPVEIETAADAARALEPIAGELAKALMGLGLIGSGLLAVPVLTTAGAYALCDAMGWNSSLDAKPARAKEFYIIIGVSTLVGLGINFVGISPVSALFWTSVINGFLAPPLLVIIMLISNNKKIMGARVNGPWINALGWATTAAMFAAVIGLVLTWGS